MENFIDSVISVLEYCWDTAGNSITGWTKMPKYDKFDLLYSVKLENLICSLGGILPEVTFPPYLIPRRKQKGGNVVRKGNPRSFFSPLTWHIHMPLPKQMGTTFSPLLHTFRLFGEFFPPQFCLGSELWIDFISMNTHLRVRECILWCSFYDVLIPYRWTYLGMSCSRSVWLFFKRTYNDLWNQPGL